MAGFFLALCDMPIQEPLLYLCDNQSLLKAVTRWIGEVGKATFMGAGHLTRIFWQQPLRYYERGLQQGQQPSWSK